MFGQQLGSHGHVAALGREVGPADVLPGIHLMAEWEADLDPLERVEHALVRSFVLEEQIRE